MNKDFYFNFSVSKRPYDRNNDNAAYITWRETNGNITTLSQYITEGYAYCNTFFHNGKTFTHKTKNAKNVKSANLICIDLDAVKYPYNEFVATMEKTEIKPNIVYTTRNNGHFKPNKDEEYNNRYRAIYVIDVPIYNDTLYQEVHQALKNEIRIITEDKNIFNDNTDVSVAHFFAGCKGASITTDGNIYPLTWLMERYGISTENEKSAGRYNNKDVGTPQSDNHSNNKGDSTPQSNENGGKHTYVTDYFYRKFNDLKSATRYNIKKAGGSIIKSSCTFSESENQFIEDYYDLSFSELIHKYIRTYPSIECTQIEVDDTQEIITLPSDYTEIRRKWYKETVEGNNGQIYNLPNVHKTRNGEGRRNLLFKNLFLTFAPQN